MGNVLEHEWEGTRAPERLASLVAALFAEAVLAEASGLHSLLRPLRLALQAGKTRDLEDAVHERCGRIHVRAVAKGGGALPSGTVLEDLQLRGERPSSPKRSGASR